jgi:hypothetical protein
MDAAAPIAFVARSLALPEIPIRGAMVIEPAEPALARRILGPGLGAAVVAGTGPHSVTVTSIVPVQQPDTDRPLNVSSSGEQFSAVDGSRALIEQLPVWKYHCHPVTTLKMQSSATVMSVTPHTEMPMAVHGAVFVAPMATTRPLRQVQSPVPPLKVT